MSDFMNSHKVRIPRGKAYKMHKLYDWRCYLRGLVRIVMFLVLIMLCKRNGLLKLRARLLYLFRCRFIQHVLYIDVKMKLTYNTG